MQSSLNSARSEQHRFVSMAGETMNEKDRSYVSKVELAGVWTDGFVYPEAAEVPDLYLTIQAPSANAKSVSLRATG